MTQEASFEERPAAETDLAARRLGGTVMGASDESFGEKENLLVEAPASFEPGHYGHRGEIVDGWETRRRRDGPGHDWVVVRLGVGGVVTSVDVDTSFFLGNYPESCRLEACGVEGFPSLRDLESPETVWVELVPPTPLKGGEHNLFPVTDERRFSHVRLSAVPDGGMARLRVHGVPLPDPRELDAVSVDLVSERNGGFVAACSDGFFSSPRQLIRPDEARVMGEGWETRRRRDDGHDFVVFGLGIAGTAHQAVVDTSCFRYNASASVALSASALEVPPPSESPDWQPLLPQTSLQPDTRHVFRLHEGGVQRWVRLDAFPDGGIARFRLTGDVDSEARASAGLRFFNVLPPAQAVRVLTDLHLDAAAASDLVGRRPLDRDEAAGFEALAPLFRGRPRGS